MGVSAGTNTSTEYTENSAVGNHVLVSDNILSFDYFSVLDNSSCDL